MTPASKASWLDTNVGAMSPAYHNDVTAYINSTPDVKDAVVKMKTSQPSNPAPSYASPYQTQAPTAQLNPYSATNSVRTLAGQAQDNQVSQFGVTSNQNQQSITNQNNQAATNSNINQQQVTNQNNQFDAGLKADAAQNTITNNRNAGNDAITNAIGTYNVTGRVPTVLADVPVKIDTPAAATTTSTASTIPTGQSYSSVNPTSISSILPASSGIVGATNVMRNIDGGYSYTDSTGHYATYKPSAPSSSTSSISSETLPAKAGVTGATNVVKLSNGSYSYTSSSGARHIYTP